MLVPLLNPYRKNRRRGKNSWFGHPVEHAKAARRGWKHRAGYKVKRKLKHRTRKSIRKLPAPFIEEFSAYSNPRRRSRGRASSRSVSFNPSGFLGSMTAGFQPSTLKMAAPIMGGLVATEIVNSYLYSAIEGFLPAMVRTKFTPAAFSMLTSGLLYAGAQKVLPKYAQGVLIGGVASSMSQLIRAANILPMPKALAGMAGLGDYLTPSGAATARALHGMSDYLTPQGAATARQLHGMGTFLTTEAVAAAQPLNGMGYLTMREAKNPRKLDGYPEIVNEDEMEAGY